MDVRLYIGEDFSSKHTHIVTYDRDQNICTGIGLFRVELTLDIYPIPDLYDPVVLYEDDVKKGTYYIHSIDRSSETFILSCQDASLKLATYFIAESYFVDYASTSDYWIKKF